MRATNCHLYRLPSATVHSLQGFTWTLTMQRWAIQKLTHILTVISACDRFAQIAIFLIIFLPATTGKPNCDDRCIAWNVIASLQICFAKNLIPHQFLFRTEQYHGAIRSRRYNRNLYQSLGFSDHAVYPRCTSSCSVFCEREQTHRRVYPFSGHGSLVH